MTADSAVSRSVQPFGFTLYLFFLIFLLLAPLCRGGDEPIALLLLELAAIGFLLTIVWTQRAPLALPGMVTVAIGVLLVYPLVQVIPLPPWLWKVLPGRAEYAAVLERFVEGGLWRPISVIPSATEYGWLALLPPLACLLAALRLAPAHAAGVLRWMMILAGVQGVLGFMQVASGAESVFYLGNEQAFGTAVGTFVNHNHFAGLLGMMLPVSVGLLVFRNRPSHRDRGRRSTSTLRNMFAPGRLFVLASAATILPCLLLTRSAVGIAAAFVGVASSTILLVRARAVTKGSESTEHADYVVLGLVVVATVLAVASVSLLERIEPAPLRLSTEGRLAIYWATLRAAVEFLPFGSGLSTFADVFPRFQAEGFVGYIDNAHNDYLQAFLELGVAAIVIVGLLLAAYICRMVELLRRESAHGFTLLQLAAGIGMLPMLLQSLFDFALHMPANAMWFATLAGVLFHQGVAFSVPIGDGGNPSPSGEV